MEKLGAHKPYCEIYDNSYGAHPRFYSAYFQYVLNFSSSLFLLSKSLSNVGASLSVTHTQNIEAESRMQHRFFFLFKYRVLPSNSGWPGTSYVDQKGLELRDAPDSAGLKVCTLVAFLLPSAKDEHKQHN